MTTTTEGCAKCGRPFEAHMWCAECGRPVDQPADPGSYREYCSNACRQRAYRARGGRASGTRYESAGARRRREEEEAYAREEARREKERQRARARRGQAHDSSDIPSWCRAKAGDDAARARRRERVRLLIQRAMHHGTNEEEADTCRRMAEKMRVKYGL